MPFQRRSCSTTAHMLFLVRLITFVVSGRSAKSAPAPCLRATREDDAHSRHASAGRAARARLAWSFFRLSQHGAPHCAPSRAGPTLPASVTTLSSGEDISHSYLQTSDIYIVVSRRDFRRARRVFIRLAMQQAPSRLRLAIHIRRHELLYAPHAHQQRVIMPCRAISDGM